MEQGDPCNHAWGVLGVFLQQDTSGVGIGNGRKSRASLDERTVRGGPLVETCTPEGKDVWRGQKRQTLYVDALPAASALFVAVIS